MKIDFTNLFVLYLLVFLAVIAGAWIMFLWQRRRETARVRRFFICAYCDEKIRLGTALKWIRCPRCGARQKLGHQTPVTLSKTF